MSHRYYPRSVQWLHWLMAFALIGMVVFGLFMGSLPLSDERRDSLMLVHLSTGVLLLLAVAVRVRWRLQGRMPSLPAVYRPWERMLAHAVHLAFYGLMFMLPLLGLSVWLLDPFVWGPGLAGQSIALANLAGWLHWAHYLGGWLLIALLILHVIGAIRGFASTDVDRQVWRRMVGRAAVIDDNVTISEKSSRRRGR